MDTILENWCLDYDYKKKTVIWLRFHVEYTINEETRQLELCT